MATVEEIWKPVLGFEGLYEVSNIGRVKSLSERRKGGFVFERELIMTPSNTRNEYLTVRLSNKGTIKNFLVHILVAKAFHANPLNLPVVNHKDTDKTNNCEWNLEWTTVLDNNLHAIANGLNPFTENHRKAVVGNLAHAKAARMRLVLNNENGVFYESLKEAAGSANIKPHTLLKRMTKSRSYCKFQYI